MWVLKCLCHFIGTVAQNLREGRFLLLFNAVISDSAEFLSCVESAFCFALWNKLECWWCGSTGEHSLSPRVCKCDLLLELLHFFGKLFFWNDGYSIKPLDLCRNNNRKNSETTGFLYQVWNVCQWKLPVFSTATPANLLADWPMSDPCTKKETTKNLKTKLWSQPENQLCTHKQVLFELGDCSPGLCCPPCRLSCQPRGLIWCSVWMEGAVV